ncbi:DENN domain-containing protein 1A isoform X5 [Nelusetta ayraudi]|uniref:DENN domain-containing protein 1A isoform X5 n=1 Tax=Nelusetta ayraudi TaxID=303726 RepID=UPI003F6FABF4
MGSRIKDGPESTFQVYVEISHHGLHTPGPEVRRQFPEDYTDQDLLQTLPKFCFPFNLDSTTVHHSAQNFTFVLTDVDSKHRFGFCRLSPSGHTCYCIVSYLPWFEVFYKLLNIVADDTVKGQESQWKELLVSLHTLPIPEPGVSVHLGVHYFFTVPDTQELPSIPENRNLTEYLVAVDVTNMLHLYASMLYERRILICCSKLSTLTACVHGSAAMLCPMFWQHVYIPVLPQHLLDYCCAPMPFLIGVHSSLMERVRRLALDDVVVLNVDTNTLETPYDDLQSLPSDVISSLKSRLKKVSTTTGDGVARAFLKSQAALFGSYRNALQIESGEPITFNEEVFMNHRSSVMKQFLQNAIQLQLFKQFIDGRLDLLNAGEGFNDLFEEEINLSEDAGSDKTYHQWLLTMKKGGGAIFNTVRTKANPAMKTVYKLAKDHAKMRIKEVKTKLKQREQSENGFSVAALTVLSGDHPGSAPSYDDVIRGMGPSQTLDGRRPVNVHHGQARPIMLKRASSNMSLESSISQPQPYQSLKEAEPLEGDAFGLGPESHTAPPSPVNQRFSNVKLLGDIFSCQDEPDSQQVNLTKSLEDLRTSKDPQDLQEGNFSYQVRTLKQMELCMGGHAQPLPGLKLPNTNNKLWRTGTEKSTPPPATCEGAQAQPEAHTAPGCESSRSGLNRSDTFTSGNITIPRPHGRKTPELGSVLVVPAGQICSRGAAEGEEEGGNLSSGREFQQALDVTPKGGHMQRSTTSTRDIVDLINLDPLMDPGPANFDSMSKVGNVGVVSSTYRGTLPLRSYPHGSSPLPPRPHLALNPFAQHLLHLHNTCNSPQMHYAPPRQENPFAPVHVPRPGSYFHTPPQPQSFPAVQGLYGLQHSFGSLTHPSVHGRLHSAFPHEGATRSPLPSSASNSALSGSADSPAASEGDAHNRTQDPFADLLTMVKEDAAPKETAADLRWKWETFE